MSEQAVQHLRIVSGDPDTAVGEQAVGLVQFVDEDGAPVDVGGGEAPSVPAAMTAAEAEAGTVEEARVVSPKVLADEIDRRVAAAIANLPAG